MPDLAVELTEYTDDHELLILLEQGDLDLVLTHLPLPEGPFEATPLFVDDYVLVARRDSPPPCATPPSRSRGSRGCL